MNISPIALRENAARARKNLQFATAENLEAAALALESVDALRNGATLPREDCIERALSWAAQQTYSFSRDTLDSYCALRNLTWSSDAMYGYITFAVKS